MTDNPLRIVQWTTGNVAREAVRAVLARPDLEIVGVYAHSAGKVGRDLAELVGLDEPTGIEATDDVDALLALAPDCVVYTPLHFDVDEVERLLGAGVNIVATAEILTGCTLDADARARLHAAADAGGATYFGSGMNPGFSALLAAVASGISRDIRHVKISESVDVTLFAGDANFDGFGWGRPAGDPDHPDDLAAATFTYVEALDAVARLLGIDEYECRFTTDFAHATEDLDLPGRYIATGTVAGIDIRLEAVVDATPRIEMHQRYVMGTTTIDPPWTIDHGYHVDVTGNPRVHLKLEIWPDLDDLAQLTVDEMKAIGLRISSLPIVDAIPAVCAAPPGIRTYADLPIPTARLT